MSNRQVIFLIIFSRNLILQGSGQVPEAWLRRKMPGNVRLDRRNRRASAVKKPYSWFRAENDWGAARVELWRLFYWPGWGAQFWLLVKVRLTVFNHSSVDFRPVRIFPDPFRGAPHILVLSSVLNYDRTPADTNHRHSCSRTMKKVADEKPWFGMEQEWTMLDLDGHPYRWPKGGYPGPQGKF